jgi:hypothetical protein
VSVFTGLDIKTEKFRHIFNSLGIYNKISITSCKAVLYAHMNNTFPKRHEMKTKLKISFISILIESCNCSCT